VNISDENDTARHFLTPGPVWAEIAFHGPPGAHHWPGDKVSSTLSALAWFCFHYYLDTSSARWFFRATEDVMINWTSFDHFITEVDRQGDPYTEMLAFGNCVGGDPVYPQGGSGYFFSRRLVYELSTNWKYLQFTEDLGLPEDIAMGVCLAKTGVSMYSVTSERFLGHQFRGAQMGHLMDGSWEKLPVCPEKHPGQKACRGFYARVNEIAVAHARPDMPDMADRKAFATKMWAAPSSVLWYQDGMEPTLCLAPL
jgi:hypothetical protein